jgi:hypothetical protein
MIKHRIAGTAALATFGLAAPGGLAFAAPGNADAGSGRSSDSSSSASGGSSGVESHTLPNKLSVLERPSGADEVTLKLMREMSAARNG